MTRRELDATAAAWAEYQREHADEIPPKVPRDDPAWRDRQRVLSKLYMNFLRSRGNPFLRRLR